MKKFFKVLVIALAMLCGFSQVGEAKVKKARKTKAKTSKTIIANNNQDEGDNWLIGEWESETKPLGIGFKLTINNNHELEELQYIPGYAYPFSTDYNFQIVDNTIRIDFPSGKSKIYKIDKQGGRLYEEEIGVYFRKIKKK